MKPIPKYVLDTIETYKRLGHVAHVYPRLGVISLDGHPSLSPYAAYVKMRNCIERTIGTCPRCGSTQHTNNECVIGP